MRCLADLYGKIFDDKIEMLNYSMGCCEAATIQYKGRYGIFIDRKKINNPADEFLALSHEYGHCKTGTTHKVYSPYQLIEQHENRANRAAVYEFLPYSRIMEAVNNDNNEIWQIAEYLDLPEQFVKNAIDIYKAEEGV